MGDGKTIGVLLVEDHQVVREGIVALLAVEDDIEVVGTATDGLEALEKAHDTLPDVMVTDIGIPGLNGIELTRRVQKELPDVASLALSMHDDLQMVHRAFKAGVSGYLLKGVSISELCDAIRAVARGEKYLGSDVPADPGVAEDRADPLSDREREVLQLVAEGYTAKEIGERLGLSPRTVDNHRSNIMDRLGIRTIAGLVRYAIRNGISI
jgi:two-component system nitrate/nitrite response regulator NarL